MESLLDPHLVCQGHVRLLAYSVLEGVDEVDFRLLGLACWLQDRCRNCGHLQDCMQEMNPKLKSLHCNPLNRGLSVKRSTLRVVSDSIILLTRVSEYVEACFEYSRALFRMNKTYRDRTRSPIALDRETTDSPRSGTLS